MTAPSAAMHVLVVDDDPGIRDLVGDYLREHGLTVSTAADGAQMSTVLAGSVIDLVILDLKLPGEDGMVLARRLREQSSIPIIIVTGRADPADRVMGLELAADDYVTKPFDLRELLARVRSVIRRSRAASGGSVPRARGYRFEGWELNVPLRRLTSPDGTRTELTNGEFNLLVAFLSSPRRILSRDRLLELTRLNDAEVYDRSIDVQILRLRRKIEENPSQPVFIRTERRAGYVFDAEVDVI